MAGLTMFLVLDLWKTLVSNVCELAELQMTSDLGGYSPKLHAGATPHNWGCVGRLGPISQFVSPLVRA
jgi:hypothetical protein